MTPQQIALIQASWQRVLPIQKEAAALFYARLFELDPALRPMFKGDMTEQGRKLTAMLATVVACLDRLDALLPTVRELGRRHAGYGVAAVHYGTVGEALLWTLRRGLGAGFTAETEEAWVAAYGALAGVMQEGAAAS